MIKGIVVGYVLKVAPHPDGDKIWLAYVNTGDMESKIYQIIWGGYPIVKEGCLVPVALPGSTLPVGKVRKRRYRGVLSEGVLCGLGDLGLSESNDRVVILEDGRNLKPGDSLDEFFLNQVGVSPSLSHGHIDVPSARRSH